MNKTLTLLFFIATFAFYSCSDEQRRLNEALKLAGDNRAELEAVLEHYGSAGKDDLRYRAAVFLISNMPGHGGWDQETNDEYYERVNAVLTTKDKKRDDKIQEMKEISTELSADARWAEDVETITAEYLIYSIDHAFDLWENGRWARHVDFEQFCEYLLPYRVAEYQPLDHWRKTLPSKWENGGKLKIEKCRYIDHMNIVKVMQLHTNMKNTLAPHLVSPGEILPYHAELWDKMPCGKCDDYAVLATAAMRSKGLPIVMDFTPQWTNRSAGHTWNVLLLNNGRIKDFSGITGVDPNEIQILEDKWAKIYRYTYAKNRDLEKLAAKDPNFPEKLAGPFIRDVTSEYMATSDIAVEIGSNSELKNKVGYLGIFNNTDWIPSAYGERKGRKVAFRDVGEDNIFLPMFAIDNGFKQINYPFRLHYGGEVEYLIPDTTERFSYTFDRKYPINAVTFPFTQKWIGGRIEAANKADFSDAVTIYEIKDCLQAISVNVSRRRPFRYWRYVSSKGGEVNVSEMLFVDKDDPTKIVHGKVIGTEVDPKFPGRLPENMFDGDLLTHYLAPRKSQCWAGMDFGEPVQFSKVILYPRTDGNNIEFGDTYELYYMTEDGWHSLGRKVADDITVTFDSIPEGALYLLNNITKGKQKRPFTIENGKQIWW